MEVKHLTPRWTEDIEADERGGAVARIVRADNGDLMALMAAPLHAGGRGAYSFPVRMGPAEVHPVTQLITFGLRKLGPGVWAAHPAVEFSPQTSAFVTLIDCPDPAPWEVPENAPEASKRAPLVSV